MRANGQEGCDRKTGATVKTAALAVSIVIGAYLMAAAMGSADLAWLAWFSLVPLFAAIRLWRPAETLLAGGLWGVSLYVFTGARPEEAAISSTYTSLLLLATIPAVYAYLGARLTRWIGFSPFVLGVGWMAVEFALEPLGLRDGLLAGPQGNGTFVHWLSSAVGYVLAAFLVAFLSAAIVSVLSVVGVRTTSPYHLAGPGESNSRLVQQTFSCFPLFAIRPSQPRAPPISG